MLFSEPKIPQLLVGYSGYIPFIAFQCSSASRKFLNYRRSASPASSLHHFSALQRAENSSIILMTSFFGVKIQNFSALQRAENSSIIKRSSQYMRPDRFQCSSASRKFLNSQAAARAASNRRRFQCSSASRKFLNYSNAAVAATCAAYFSALQRAENSSIQRRRLVAPASNQFQCSSASRKFLNWKRGLVALNVVDDFSALQRAENSSIDIIRPIDRNLFEFQCSSASRKFLN